MRPRLRAGVDLDGVLHQWSPTVRRILKRKFGLEISESQTYNWIKDECSRLGKPEAWTWLWDDAGAVAEMFSGEPYPGAIEAVRQLQKSQDIIVITKRPRWANLPTLRWLGAYGIAASEVVILHAHDAKKSVIDCDWYVDDSPEVIEDLWRRTGQPVYVMDQPWNRTLAPASGHEELESWKRRVTRVADWTDLMRRVEQ